VGYQVRLQLFIQELQRWWTVQQAAVCGCVCHVFHTYYDRVSMSVITYYYRKWILLIQEQITGLIMMDFSGIILGAILRN
jgi:hypothetical protein